MQMFRSFRYRNFRLFFSGQSVSLIGTWMQRTAVSWLVYRLTESALLLGVVNFVSLIPILLLSPYAGSFIDRHNKHKILIVTQILAMLQAGTMATLVYFKVYNITAIILLSLFLGIIKAFAVTSRQSLMVDLVDDREDLPNAIALNSTMTNFARIGGPALAGILISSFGEDFCFLFNFFSFIAVLSTLFMLKIKQQTNTNKESIWIGLKEGYSYIKHDQKFAALIILIGVLSLFVIPFNTLMPVFAKTIFNGNATTFSWFESAAGIGSVASAIYIANLTNRKNIIKLMMAAGFLLGFAVLLLSYAPYLIAALVFMILCGVGMMAVSSAINIYIQTNVHQHMRGRAISYFIMAYQGILPIGGLLVGVMAHEWGAQLTVAIEGIIGLIAITIFYFFRKNMIKKEQVQKATH
ncbi:MFS transporter [Zhouia sp. PK063]|uniref:MFS transporter n=1 Tax=Zhouia sp. PK063 TaxID=3373602 RepID=UPI003795DE46